MGIKVVFGGASFTRIGGVQDPEKVEEFLKVLESEGIKHIDTSRIYDNSEELLGQLGAAHRFSIDTKYPGGLHPGKSTREDVVAVGEVSLKLLKTNCLDVFYIHAPDRKTPLEETLAGIDDFYRRGAFKRFGLSNFLPEEIEEVVRITKEKNYVRPSVYQGSYSAISRKAEAEVFPTLRKHGIVFYAHTPIAGGFLKKTRDQALQDTRGRWDPTTPIGNMHRAFRMQPDKFEFLDVWHQIAQDSGIPKAELAYRWIAYHSQLQESLGDAIVIGASSVDQLKQTLEGLRKGSLSDEVARKINEAWRIVEKGAFLDMFNSPFGITLP